MAKARRSKIIRDCLRLADSLSDESGFLPVRSLADHFSIEVVFRPLLVEAMLASVPASNEARPKWLVLVDSDRFPKGQMDFENETADQPLPGRLRNTIAHEILHSLSFRANESDFEFRMERHAGEKQEDFVNRIERETEDLSPLLLIPEKCLLRLARGSRTTFRSILELQRNCAATRDVLVNRLRIWMRDDTSGSLYGGGVENIGLGIGCWEAGKAYFIDRPVYANFRNNHLPHLFTQLASQKKLSVLQVTGDLGFVLNGGAETTITIDGHRNGEFLDYLKMRIRLSVEPKAASRNGKFLFFVEKLPES